MRILLVGANGTIGRAVARELGARHELVTAGRSAGDIRLDLADPASHGPALAQAGPLDAVVSAAGNVHFGALAEMTDKHVAYLNSEYNQIVLAGWDAGGCAVSSSGGGSRGARGGSSSVRASSAMRAHGTSCEYPSSGQAVAAC